MRRRNNPRARLLALFTLSAFAALVPAASADTTLPVWTCRASAGYVELPGLAGTNRIEPVLANGFPTTNQPDTGQCASSESGAQNVNIPAAGGPLNPTPLITLTAAFATTRITPEIAAARDQTAFANGGVLQPLRIVLGGITIEADLINATATGSCVGQTPTLTGTSQVVNLRINNTVIAIPQNGQPVDLNLTPLVRIRFNEQVRETTPAAGTTPAGAALTQRAVHIELLPTALPGAVPLANVVLGEAKADFHGAVCAPPPPPPPPAVCPAGTVAQNGGAAPLVCVLTVTAPCPAGSAADPNAGGACVIVRDAPAANCPNGTVRDPATNNCILVRDRPCPAGATADPVTRVCVVTVTNTNNTGSSTVTGENGRVGSSTGPVATCGRLEMHFVRGGKRTLTNRFGNRVVTRGRLVTCGSNPRSIVGARIDVVHVLPDGRRLRKTGLRTRSAGRATLILPLNLRSRRIEYSYRPDLRSTRVTSRVTLRLTVRDRNGRILNR